MLSISAAAQLALLPPRERDMVLLSMTEDDRRAMLWDWGFWSRPEQRLPPGSWNVWMPMAGRGWGKTRCGSETIRELQAGQTPLSAGQIGRIALVGETAADVRDVMVQGPSGILAVTPPDRRPRYIKSERKLEWPNGAIALTFSAEDPEQLRGPEHDFAWSDEMAKWRYAQETWDMLQFGLRVGRHPRQLVTTTPRPIPLVRRLIERWRRDPNDVRITLGTTFDNEANLASGFIGQMRERYDGTRLGRQELYAELLDDVPGALWTRRMLEARGDYSPLGALMPRGEQPPQMRRVVVAVDPSGSSGEDDDSSCDIGIVVAGLGYDDAIYVLADYTLSAGPAQWATVAVNAYRHHQADCIVGERNYGGAMVEFTIRSVQRSVPFKNVTATRGKVVRAEPVAALYEQGRVRHIHAFPQLEDQLCSFTTTGYLGRGSPDRADALVWAVTELLGENDGYDPAMWARLGGSA